MTTTDDMDRAWSDSEGPEDVGFFNAVQTRGGLYAAWDPGRDGATTRLELLYIGWTAGRENALTVKPPHPKRTEAERRDLHARFRKLAQDGVAPEAIMRRLGTTMGELLSIEAELVGAEEVVQPRDVNVNDMVLLLEQWWRVKAVQHGRPGDEGSTFVKAVDWRGHEIDHRYIAGTMATRWQASRLAGTASDPEGEAAT